MGRGHGLTFFSPYPIPLVLTHKIPTRVAVKDPTLKPECPHVNPGILPITSLSFLVCKMDRIIVPNSQGSYEVSKNYCLEKT